MYGVHSAIYRHIFGVMALNPGGNNSRHMTPTPNRIQNPTQSTEQSTLYMYGVQRTDMKERQ